MLLLIESVRFHLKINWHQVKLPNRYISCTPRSEAADVGLEYFPIERACGQCCEVKVMNLKDM